MNNEIEIMKITNQIKQLENQRDALINQDKKAKVIDQSTMCLSAEPMVSCGMAMLCCREKGHLGKHRHDMLGSIIEWANKTFRCGQCQEESFCEVQDCEDCEDETHSICDGCHWGNNTGQDLYSEST